MYSEMLDVLEQRGWCVAVLESYLDDKGNNLGDNPGPVCLIGARNVVLFGDSMQEQDGGYSEDGLDVIWQAIVILFPKWAAQHRLKGKRLAERCWLFNDRHTYEDVKAVLEEAARIEEASVAQDVLVNA